jgi:hypothetical protein
MHAQKVGGAKGNPGPDTGSAGALSSGEASDDRCWDEPARSLANPLLVDSSRGRIGGGPLHLQVLDKPIDFEDVSRNALMFADDRE